MRLRTEVPEPGTELDFPGWEGTVMGWLRVGVQLVALNALWCLGVLAGGIVTGLLPATCAVHELSRLSRSDPSMHLWHDFWRSYRMAYRPALPAGSVLTLVVLIGGVDLLVLRRAAGVIVMTLAPIAILSILAAAVLCYCAPLVQSRHLGGARLLTAAAGLTIASPGTTLGVVLTGVVAAAAAVQWPLVGVLVGASAPVAASTMLTRVRLTTVHALPDSAR